MKSAAVNRVYNVPDARFAVGQPVYVDGLPEVWLVCDKEYSTVMHAWIYDLFSKEGGDKKRSEVFLTPARFASPPLVEVI